MPRFLTGDELGNIKSIRYFSNSSSDPSKIECKLLYAGISGERSKAIQDLVVSQRGSEGPRLIMSGFSDGSASVFSLDNDDVLEEVHIWKETRLRAEQRYIGLAVSETGAFSCTSNGALRYTTLREEGDPTVSLSSLPSRLWDWKMSSNQENFAYGGDEVDLSVWNSELAFLARPPEISLNKKRKRDVSLLPGEIWRAKNVHNDIHDLRQPVRITSLTYLPSSSGTYHLITGTQLGDIRRYDTRTARRPVSDWKISKNSGIKALENGMVEHQIFLSDERCNLYALDLRNGGVMYGYKGLSGAVTSIAPSPSLMASTSLDRYTRIHSTFPPPSQVGQQQKEKGVVLDKVFMKCTPTIIAWDRDQGTNKTGYTEEDDIWETMKGADDGEWPQQSTTRTKRSTISDK